jgi:hypothetical protein
MTANIAGPIWGLTPHNEVATIEPADTTTPKAIYTAGANGGRVIGIGATTNDTAANDVNLYIQVAGAGTARNIGGKRVPIAAGNVVASTIPAISLLDPVQIPCLLADGSLQLGPGDVLQAGVVATVTTAKTLSLFIMGTDY